MAVDTRDKRYSVIGLTQPTFPDPNGAIDTQDERQHTAFVYSGLLASSPAVIVIQSAKLVYTVAPSQMQYNVEPAVIETSVQPSEMQYTVTK